MKPKCLGSISIGGYSYRVFVVPGDLRAPDNDPVRGYCDNGRQEIYLSGDLPEDELAETFCHEVFHAVAFSYRLPFTHEQEESLAGPIGLGFAQALKPWLKGRLRKSWK